MAINVQMREQVSQLYVALFGRAPDGEGLGYWVGQLDAGKTMVDVANTMYATAPARTIYPSFLTNQEIIGNFYTNVLGRTADAEGLAFWTAKLNAADATAGSVIAEMINTVANYSGTDPDGLTSQKLFNNKVAVAQWYGEHNGDIAGANTVLAAVTSDPASVDAVKTGGAQSSQTYTLTTGQDVFNGNAGADILRGVAGAAIGQQDQTTLNSSDVLDGAAGEDSLVVLLNGNYGGGATIKNIETLQIGQNVGGVTNFDYNVNNGVYEVTGVNTVVYDQITAGETLNVNNVTPSATGTVIPTLKWDNEAGSVAGTAGVTFREASVAGTTTQLNIVLDDVNNGVFNIAGGVETLKVTSQGSTANVLANSTAYDDNGAGAGLNANVDLLSGAGTAAANDDNSLTKVIIDGAQAFGKAAAVVADATNANYGLTDRSAAGSDVGLTAATTASDLVSVAATVTEVDASAATGNISLRFTQKVNNADTNVTYKGGKGADYVEFERGAVNASGGEGNDTFSFITQMAGVTNSGFGSTDSIDGGAGADTIQLGLNGVGTYTLNTTEFSNKTGIDELDLRGANNDVTVSSQFVAAADTGVKLTIRTDKIVQTSASSTANPTGANVAENNSTSIINLTDLAINQGVKVVGGSGSERVVVDNAAMNANVEIDGGTNGGVAGRYDTITVLDSAVLDSGDLANVKGIEALVLAETVNGNSTFRIDLTEAFLLNNTAATNATTTTIDDTTFRIGSANSVSGTALNAGDTVTIDISDLLNANRTALKTSLAGRGVDVALGAAAVNYVVDGAAATAAQIALVAKADAARADAGVSSAAGAVIAPAVALTAGGTFTGTAGVNDTFTGDQASLTGTTVTGTAADTETLTLTNAGTLAIPATVTNIDVLNLANGTNVITGITAAGVTTVNGGTGSDTVTANAAGMSFAGGEGNDSYISAVGATLGTATINGGNGVDTLTLVTGDSLANASVTNMDNLNVTAGATITVGANSLLTQFTALNASATGGSEVINIAAGSHDISNSTVGAFLIEAGQTTTWTVAAGASLTVGGDAQLTAANTIFAGAGTLTTTGDLTFAVADTFTGTLNLGAGGLTFTDRAAATTVVGTSGADTINMQTTVATGAKTINLGSGGADVLSIGADTTTALHTISGWTTAAVIDLDTTAVTAATVTAAAATVLEGTAGAATNLYILDTAASQISGALSETTNGGAVEQAIQRAALTSTAGTNGTEFYLALDNGTDTGIYRVAITQGGTAGLLDNFAEIAATHIATIVGVQTSALAANDFS